MVNDIVGDLKAERASLLRKLAAIDAALAAYGETDRAYSPSAEAPEVFQVPGVRTSKRGKVPLDRFSEYGASVVKAATEVIRAGDGRPIPTRELVDSLKRRGVQIRGADQANALSALLSRSADVVSNGRSGWTIDESEPGGCSPPDLIGDL